MKPNRFTLAVQKFYTPLAWLVSGPIRKRLLTRLYFGSFPRPFEEFCAARFNGCAGVRGAEVGVFRGNHAASLCKTVRPAILYCVDGYKAYNEWEHLEKLMADARKSARRRLAKHRVEFVEKDCMIVNLKSLDFCYIDAAHDYGSVCRHLCHCWDWVRPGGVIGGHDFCRHSDDEGVVAYGVVEAVTEFVASNGLKLYVKGDDWWVVKP